MQTCGFRGLNNEWRPVTERPQGERHAELVKNAKIAAEALADKRFSSQQRRLAENMERRCPAAHFNLQRRAMNSLTRNAAYACGTAGYFARYRLKQPATKTSPIRAMRRGRRTRKFREKIRPTVLDKVVDNRLNGIRLSTRKEPGGPPAPQGTLMP
jgi:hypothetical protein